MLCRCGHEETEHWLECERCRCFEFVEEVER